VVPVGVGSLAQAVVQHYRSGTAAPALLAVEPRRAACALASLRAGEPVSVPTGVTVMAGLNCGTVSGLAWPYLAARLDAAVAVSDAASLAAVAELAAPHRPVARQSRQTCPLDTVARRNPLPTAARRPASCRHPPAPRPAAARELPGPAAAAKLLGAAP